MDLPETHYANSHGLSIAYQVMGEGAIDLVIAPALISHIELFHEFPGYTRYLRRLSEFARVITFDKRGQGLSDAMDGVPTLEERVDDISAVMDDVGSKKAAIFGFSEGSTMAFMLAASHPSRVSHVITFGGYAKACGTTDYPHMPSEEVRRANLMKWVDDWGRGGGVALKVLAPEIAEDQTMRKTFARIERYTNTPQAMKKYFEVNFKIDVLKALPLVKAPTLVLQREDDIQVTVAAGRHLTETIQNSRYVDAGTGGHGFFAGNISTSINAIREFITGEQSAEIFDNRVLSTVLFTDIVNSTNKLQALGDDVWRDLLDRHDELSKEIIALNRGRYINSTGDGILATFDGPGRGVECALQLSERLGSIGLPIRAGLHTGEVELRGGNISGSAVHIAARIEGLAKEGEVFVSRTVSDLMVGNIDIRLEAKGIHTLKGVQGEWEILRAIW